MREDACTDSRLRKDTRRRTGRRQIVGSVMHLSDDEQYRRLNDVVCVCVGEVRAPEDKTRESPDLVIDVAELIWEPIDG